MDEYEKYLQSHIDSCSREDMYTGRLSIIQMVLNEYRAFKAKADGGLVEKLKALCKIEPQIIKAGHEYETELICRGRLQIKDRLKEILRAHEGGAK